MLTNNDLPQTIDNFIKITDAKLWPEFCRLTTFSKEGIKSFAGKKWTVWCEPA